MRPSHRDCLGNLSEEGLEGVVVEAARKPVRSRWVRMRCAGLNKLRQLEERWQGKGAVGNFVGHMEEAGRGCV